jgi:hypothetical protein
VRLIAAVPRKLDPRRAGYGDLRLVHRARLCLNVVLVNAVKEQQQQIGQLKAIQGENPSNGERPT